MRRKNRLSRQMPLCLIQPAHLRLLLKVLQKTHIKERLHLIEPLSGDNRYCI